MKEAEVSLKIALYYIKNGYTEKDVQVSLDGAHIKTGNKIVFDITYFMNKNACKKKEDDGKWQGTYEVEGYKPRIIVSSTPGVGDVNIHMIDGKQLFVESKKGQEKNRSNSEYPLMREAIGQLMTGCPMTDNMVPVVAVPYTEKSYELARRWSELKQIQAVGIKFILVHENGEIDFI